MAKDSRSFCLDYVRLASKEIVCALLPDELPFFDTVWSALEPVLADPRLCSEFFSRQQAKPTNGATALSLATGLREGADILAGSVVMLLERSLALALANGVYSEKSVAEIVAGQNMLLAWYLPNEFLRMISVFVAGFCGIVTPPDNETQELLDLAKSRSKHTTCYVVFYDGEHHFFHNAIPEEILTQRQELLFWLNWPEQEFLTAGRPGNLAHVPKDMRELVLQFLCRKGNAGRTVDFLKVYSSVWSQLPASPEKMTNSVGVEVSRLNSFTWGEFQGKKEENMLCRLRGNQYRIHPHAHKQCCIIRRIGLPQ